MSRCNNSSWLGLVVVVPILIFGLVTQRFRATTTKEQQQQQQIVPLVGFPNNVTELLYNTQKYVRDWEYANNPEKLNKKKKRVKVTIYDETLCIDCKHFIVDVLVPTYTDLGPEIIDLSLVSFGNAKYDESGTLICQHGIAECDANAYNLCVADIYDYHIDRYFPFLTCLFETLPMGHHDTVFDTSIFASCARRTAVNWDVIKACHDDTERVTALQQKAFKETPAEHQYVPWIEINNIFWDQSGNTTFRDAICDTYIQQGGEHPACASRSSSNTEMQ